MKTKKSQRLQLNKKVIQNLLKVLDQKEQKQIKGGTPGDDPIITQVPVIC